MLGTSAYTHHLIPQVRHRFVPLYDYILVSEPLTRAQREAIGWRRRQGMTMGGTSSTTTAPPRTAASCGGPARPSTTATTGSIPSCDYSPRHYESPRASWRRTFPQLAELAWPYAWGGPICSTTRLTPYFGRALGQRAFYALGYTGHGLGSTRLAGDILAHRALERQSELFSLARAQKPPFPYPPEPLRGWAVSPSPARCGRSTEGGARRALAPPERMGIGFSS